MKEPKKSIGVAAVVVGYGKAELHIQEIRKHAENLGVEVVVVGSEKELPFTSEKVHTIDNLRADPIPMIQITQVDYGPTNHRGKHRTHKKKYR